MVFNVHILKVLVKRHFSLSPPLKLLRTGSSVVPGHRIAGVLSSYGILAHIHTPIYTLHVLCYSFQSCGRRALTSTVNKTYFLTVLQLWRGRKERYKQKRSREEVSRVRMIQTALPDDGVAWAPT